MKKTSCIMGIQVVQLEKELLLELKCKHRHKTKLKTKRKNVLDVVKHDKTLIYNAITKQIKKQKKISQKIYGNGNAGKKIADILSKSSISKINNILIDEN